MKSITLNLGGKERQFHFGFGFIGRLLEQNSIGYVQFDTERISNPFKWIPIMMFHSMEYALLRDDKQIDFTLNDVIEWIDNTDLQTLTNFRDGFDKSLVRDVPEQKEIKKKVVKK